MNADTESVSAFFIIKLICHFRNYKSISDSINSNQYFIISLTSFKINSPVISYS